MCFCCGCQLYCLEGDGGHLRLAGDWLKLNLAEDSWELTDLLDEGLTSKGALLEGARQHGWWETQENSTDFCLMESGLERQGLTICLEMQSLVDCFSTTWVIPTGLLRVEILSARIETGVGMTVSRAHWADSVWNSVLRVVGMPEQRSKPEAEPDLLMR